MAKTKEEKEEGARSFARFIEKLAFGEAHSVLSEKLHRLTQAVEAEATDSGGATGRLTFELVLKADAKGAFKLEYDVKIKEPKQQRSFGLAWATKGGNLTFEHPRQPGLPGVVRDVSAPQVRDADEEELVAARDV